MNKENKRILSEIRTDRGFEFCFDEKSETLCTRDTKTGEIKKIPDEILGENLQNKWENNEKL